MRTEHFHASALHDLLRKKKICSMEEMKAALGTGFHLTVLRKLKTLSYRTSYSDHGKYYTLEEIAQWDGQGLWVCEPARFSRHGTLLKTVEQFVCHSEAGYPVGELEQILKVGTQEPLLKLYREHRISRERINDVYVYCDNRRKTEQLKNRRVREAGTLYPGLGTGVIRVKDEVKAALVLFWSVLNEKQRRLYAGLESMMWGRGGDSHLAQMLGLEVHTIARGRRELMRKDVDLSRIRKIGGGRKAVEKKHPGS